MKNKALNSVLALLAAAALTGCSSGVNSTAGEVFGSTGTHSAPGTSVASGGTGADSGDMFAEEAPAADAAEAGGFVGEYCEPIIDPIDPIDPAEPISPQPDPQAGLLTGGEWNDNENWDFWQGLYSSNNYGVDWDSYRDIWQTGVKSRAAVTVKDGSGAPVPGARVEGLGYAAVTDNKGRAYLFFDERGLQGETSEFTVTFGSSAQRFTESVDGGCELELTLSDTAKPAAKSLDLMIMCDATGSMGDELEYLKAELEDVVTRIRDDNANLPTRISVNFYRDEGDEYVVREYPFTTDLGAAVTAISEQSADGGGDTPEAVHTALASAVSNDWAEDSVKVMFLVLDAPPHDDPQIIAETVEHIREAAEKGIRIVPVAASGVDKSCEYLLRSMAIMTGGTYVFLTDDSGIGGGHIEPTIGSCEVEKLNDMMVRIVSGYLE
ncbi:MAG: VWA domain-containing protein [Oscillospiraceae bacterium]|nr:VWA domain-containing protein [Oscillospiraceae bacterium]